MLKIDWDLICQNEFKDKKFENLVIKIIRKNYIENDLNIEKKQ